MRGRLSQEGCRWRILQPTIELLVDLDVDWLDGYVRPEIEWVRCDWHRAPRGVGVDRTYISVMGVMWAHPLTSVAKE